jgi:hypothetical protein
MSDELELANGHIKPEEFNAVLDSLLYKLVNSRAISYPSLFSPLTDFIKITGSDYVPSVGVQTKIREQVEERIERITRLQSYEMAGKFEPFEDIGELCEWGIVASHLEISYDIDKVNDDPELAAMSGKLSDILNFELHHFNYDSEFDEFGTFLPLDIVYFAKLNGIIDCLEGRTLSEIDERCAIPDFREATSDESRQHLDDLKEELTERVSQGYENLSENEIGIEILEKLLDGPDGKKGNDRFNWKDSDGTMLCYPDVTQNTIDSLTPRQPQSTSEVKEYLSQRLETALVEYCAKGYHDDATEIAYRRNRVKDFLGSDINVPQKLAEHDDDVFSSVDPKEVRMWINNMVTVFGPHDMGSELALPTNLNKKEYRLFRSLTKAMEYIKKGDLTYDTQDKRQLLTTPLGSMRPSSYLLLLNKTD